jgi:carbamoyltransferase
MKTIWGICALNHDASITVMRGNEILFAGHAERYSRIKNDPFLNKELIAAAKRFGEPSELVWFEKPYVKKLRQAYAGQWGEVNSVTPLSYLKSADLSGFPIKYVSHHESHAAAGYFTSSFTDAAIVVVDAIGEWDTISVWHATGNDMKKIHSTRYPNSLGMLYSAVTQRIGLKPNEEEYILMGMAAYGTPVYYEDLKNDFVERYDAPNFKLKENIHRGMLWWREDITTEQDYMNLAASIQKITEEFMCDITRWASENIPSKNLVLMGGCALNCVANEKLARQNLFEDIWIMPNPGDAGSSLGCILAYTKQRATWVGPFLGTKIKRVFDVQSTVNALVKGDIIGMATGRSEYGPRALGNRSLLADPRGTTIKDRVNDIKKRQRFRPFAPMILEHLAHEYFDMPVKTSPYMQYTAKCLHPELYPAICHVDGSSRVQTINYDQNRIMFTVLEEFYKRTGCPMLLNTSLNIKGEPLVDTWADAIKFQNKYRVQMF